MLRSAARSPVLARCAGRCTCGGACRDDDEVEALGRAQLRRAVLARAEHAGRQGSKMVLATVPIRSLARQEAGEAISASADSPPAPPSSVVHDYSHFVEGPTLSESEAREVVNYSIAKLAPHGATVKPFQPNLVAAAPALQADSSSVQTWRLQRSSAYAAEGGFVGALQLCYDFCSGELSVVGWIWAGFGVVTKGLMGGKSWWGAYVFAEKEFGRWKLDFMPKVACGQCRTECKPAEHDDGAHFAGGVAGFPVLLKPGEKVKLRKAGIEVGALLTPHVTRCDADLEIIALIDLTKYLGPVGAAVSAAAETATTFGKRWNLEVECGVGVAISGAVHLCHSVPGGGVLGITSDSAKLCGGGYVGCGIGLAHEKSALPGI
jgi:hypothetical protein